MRLQDAKLVHHAEPKRIAEDARNILIVLIDDGGFGISETYGGEVHTPKLSQPADEGLRHNSFHTTSICSPKRASLLTGWNHTRVGTDNDSPVSLDYFDEAPFKFTGKIGKTMIKYL